MNQFIKYDTHCTHNRRSTTPLCGSVVREDTLELCVQAIQGLEPGNNSKVCVSECYQRAYMSQVLTNKWMYSQGSRVLTKWSSENVGAPVLTPAPTQRPAAPATATASMDASALQVQHTDTH